VLISDMSVVRITMWYLFKKGETDMQEIEGSAFTGRDTREGGEGGSSKGREVLIGLLKGVWSRASFRKPRKSFSFRPREGDMNSSTSNRRVGAIISLSAIGKSRMNPPNVSNLLVKKCLVTSTGGLDKHGG